MIQHTTVNSILNKKKNRDEWFLDDYTVNGYEGCSMNCLYCYVRESKYGINMEEKLAVKINAVEVLEKQLQLRNRKGQHGFIVLSSATDPYLKNDAKFGLTEKFLHLFIKYKFPVHVITKSERALNDVSLFKQIDAAAIVPDDLKEHLQRGFIISFSVSTLDQKISDILEPGASTPIKRMETMRTMKDMGLLTGINAMPILPYISDSDEQIEEIISTAKEYGADYILGAGLTLFGSGESDSKTLFYKFLNLYDPALIPKYEKLYGGSHFPARAYHENLLATIKRISKTYNIRNTITDEHK